MQFTKSTGAGRKALLACAAAAALVGSTALLADGGDAGFAGPFGGSPMHSARMAERLKLSEDQQTQIDAIVDGSRAQARTQARQLMAIRQRLRDAMQADAFDEANVRAVAQEQAAAQVEMLVLRARTRAQISAVLDETQRAAFNMMGERGRHGSRGGYGRHGRHGDGDQGGWRHGRGHGDRHGRG